SRGGAERGEVVDGHAAAEDTRRPGIRTRAAETHRLRKSRIRVNVSDGGGALSDVEIIRISAGAKPHTAPAAADVDQAVGFEDTGGRLEQESADDGEDRRVGPNANRERDRGGRRE